MYIPAGPLPTTATSSSGKSAGSTRSNRTGPQSWNSGEPSGGPAGSVPAKYSALIAG